MSELRDETTFILTQRGGDAKAQRGCQKSFIVSCYSLLQTKKEIDHSLFHIKRMAAAADPIYQTAVDLMLLGGLAGLCRVYCRTHNVVWEGEKAALRYLQANDPDFLERLRACLATTEPRQKIIRYEELIMQTIDTSYGLWTPGVTAIYLAEPPQDGDRVGQALHYWEELLQKNGTATPS